MLAKVQLTLWPSLCLAACAGLLASCASTSPPTLQMIYASAAMKASERASAERRSPDLFNRAQTMHWRAQRMYLAREFSEAATAAYQAKRLAERAELDAELKGLQGSAF